MHLGLTPTHCDDAAAAVGVVIELMAGRLPHVTALYRIQSVILGDLTHDDCSALLSDTNIAFTIGYNLLLHEVGHST